MEHETRNDLRELPKCANTLLVGHSCLSGMRPRAIRAIRHVDLAFSQSPPPWLDASSSCTVLRKSAKRRDGVIDPLPDVLEQFLTEKYQINENAYGNHGRYHLRQMFRIKEPRRNYRRWSRTMAAMMVENRKRVAAGGARFQGHITLIADFQTIARNTRRYGCVNERHAQLNPSTALSR
jgi:hypothetical protein